MINYDRQSKRTRTTAQVLLAVLSTLLPLSAGAQSAPTPTTSPLGAPPPAYVAPAKKKSRPSTASIQEQSTSTVSMQSFAPASVTRYQIGEPTAEEQLYLEFINRARANPAAEALRLRNTTDPDVLAAYTGFAVDLDMMVAQISPLAASPPLAFNSNLIWAARMHTADQFTNSFQGHSGSDGTSPPDRMTRAGYGWTSAGENAFTSAKNPYHGHAGFEVDWGYSVGGMQTPPGHRNIIHNSVYREIGIGVTNGINGTVGPQLVTQDFGSRPGLTPFITGVAYYDYNGNNFYDVGEGIGGVTVTISGASYYAVTGNSGGYSVPVPADGVYTVIFSANNLPTSNVLVTVSGGVNVKQDFRPPYSPPTIGGPVVPVVNRNNNYSFNPVGAATNYQWKQSMRVPATTIEGAETGTNNFTVFTTGTYAPVQSGIKASGGYGFRFAHPTPVDQVLTLNWILRPGSSSQITWASRLSWATSNQTARVQVTTNAGVSWNNLWSLKGNSSAQQTSFVRYTNSLAAYAGQEIQVRFIYDHTGGNYFNQTSSGIGWHFDDISLLNCEQLIQTTIYNTTSTAFSFVPTAATNYSLRVRAQLGDHFADWGPAMLPFASATAPLAIRISSMPVISGNRATFNFNILSGTGGTFSIQTAQNPGGPWSVDPTASITAIVAGAQYRANCATSPSGRCFYRVSVQ
jgi:uncharacterized protein YkwD